MCVAGAPRFFKFFATIRRVALTACDFHSGWQWNRTPSRPPFWSPWSQQTPLCLLLVPLPHAIRLLPQLTVLLPLLTVLTPPLTVLLPQLTALTPHLAVLLPHPPAPLTHPHQAALLPLLPAAGYRARTFSQIYVIALRYHFFHLKCVGLYKFWAMLDDDDNDRWCWTCTGQN